MAQSLEAQKPFMQHRALSRDETNERFSETIAATLDCVVVYEDILGEGPGAWDSNRRYPQKVVNCLVWLQLVISEIYGKGLADKTAIMDRIRYYGGHVGFSLRKHYLDQWMAFEPEPLVAVELPRDGVIARQICLQPQILLEDRGYPCPLYKMSHTVFDFLYLTAQGLLDYVKVLPRGYYVMFAVASDRYIKRYYGNGPMGLVHSIVLHLISAEPGAEQGPSERVYHASIKAGRVLSTELGVYVRHHEALYLGYVIYELDPAWNFLRPIALDVEMESLLNCEANIKRKRTHQAFGECNEE
jgi:hypothetical protein